MEGISTKDLLARLYLLMKQLDRKEITVDYAKGEALKAKKIIRQLNEDLQQFKRISLLNAMNRTALTYMMEVTEQTTLPMNEKQRLDFINHHTDILEAKELEVIEYHFEVSDAIPDPEENDLHKAIKSMFEIWSTFPHTSATHMKVLQCFLFIAFEKIADYYDCLPD